MRSRLAVKTIVAHCKKNLSTRVLDRHGMAILKVTNNSLSAGTYSGYVVIPAPAFPAPAIPTPKVMEPERFAFEACYRLQLSGPSILSCNFEYFTRFYN